MDFHSEFVRNGVITLENYLAFTDSRKTEDLTVNHLNQIVAMHGFTKLKASKKVIIDAVNTLDLMKLTRSTLKENTSSSVNIKGEEVITDLNILSWQECTVTSIQLINPLDYQNSNHSQSCLLQSSGQPKSIKAKPKPKKNLKSVSDVPSSSHTEASKSNFVCTSGNGESAEKKPKGEESVVKQPKSNKRKSVHLKCITG